MIECNRQDLVCLYLDALDPDLDGTVAPRSITATGIGDALEVGDAAVDRVELLSELGEMVDDGLLSVEERRVEGFEVPRPVYRVTESGRERATAVRQSVQDETVVVTNGTSEEVPLADVDRFIDETPLVTALVRLTEGGEVPLEQHTSGTFVNRSEELATAREAIAQSFRRESQTLVIAGASGMGKTALVQEAVDRVTADWPDLVVATGSSPEGATDAYSAFKQAFETLPGGEAVQRHLVAARDEFSPEDPQTARAQRAGLFTDIADSLRELSTEQPLVLFLDNLEQADEATLELFTHLATEIDELVYPISFVGNYRESVVNSADSHPLPDALERIGAGGSLHEVSLDPLSRTDTRALVADVMGRQRFPDGFVDLIYNHTGGNPLFVRETAKHLLETAQTDPDQDIYPTDPANVSLPDAVTAQIDQRLEAVDATSQQLLRLGAVLGERIPGAVLAEASDLPPSRHREYVDVLIASRLWEPIADGEQYVATGGDAAVSADGGGDLQFASGGLREAVADRLTPEEAKTYHGRVAEAFQSVYEDGEEPAARVAHHAKKAEASELALEYYRRAADRAISTYGYEDALEYYEQARDLVSDDAALSESELAELYADSADLNVSLGSLETAEANVEEGLGVAPVGSRIEARLLEIQCQIAANRGDFDQAREVGTRFRDIARSLEARELEGAAERQLGRVAGRQGAVEEANDHFETAREIATEEGDRIGEVEALNGLAGVMSFQGEYAQARSYLERSLEIVREAGDRELETSILNNLGEITRRQSDHTQAREFYQQALEISREIGYRHLEGLVQMNLGHIATSQGKYDQAREWLETALGIARDIGDSQMEAGTLCTQGRLAAAEHRFNDANERFQQSLERSRELSHPRREGTALLGLARLARRQGEYDAAMDQLAAAHDQLEAAGDSPGIAEITLEESRVALATGDLDTAETKLAEARAAFEKLAAADWLGRCERLNARLLAARGRPADAEEHWREALDTFEGIGAIPDYLLTLKQRARVASDAGNEDTVTDSVRQAREVLADAPMSLQAVHKEWVESDPAETDRD